MRQLLIFFSLFFLILPMVLGGFSSPYLENDQLKIKKGEVKDYTIVLQNPSDEGIIFILEFQQGNGLIVSKLEDAYTAEPNTFDNEVTVEFKLPKNPGKSYPVAYSVLTKKKVQEQSMIVMGNKISKQFTIVLDEEQPEIKSINTKGIIISLAIPLLGILAYLIFIKKRKP
ncbi:MAG: hypothetical protein ABIC04_04755 [Nanoarchaeota archaeon]